jgi:Holliday junction resolvasome RuvABC endonuclease subunit
MNRVLGFDPGTAKHGYCLIDVTIRTAPIWVEGGHSEEPFLLLDAYRDTNMPLVVVEEPRGALHVPSGNIGEMQARAQCLIATSWLGGEIYGYARARGFPCLKVGQQEWRNALIGRPRPGETSDHRVDAELRRIVRQMPKRSSVHARDAGGIAIVGARMWLAGRYSTIAPHLSSRIERARIGERGP